MPPFVLISAAQKYEYSQVSVNLVVYSSEVSFRLTGKKTSEKLEDSRLLQVLFASRIQWTLDQTINKEMLYLYVVWST